MLVASLQTPSLVLACVAKYDLCSPLAFRYVSINGQAPRSQRVARVRERVLGMSCAGTFEVNSRANRVEELYD